MSEVLTKMCDITYKHFSSFDSILSAFTEEPHICEDFFGMLDRILKYSPEVILHMNKFKDLIALI